MNRKGKWRVFWEQISDESDVIGTFVIGTIIFLAEFIRELVSSDSISLGAVLPGGIGLLAFLSGMILYFSRAYRTTGWIVSEKHLPVVFVAGPLREAAEAAMTKAQETISARTGFRDFAKLENSLNVSYRDLIVHRRQRLAPEMYDWVDFIRDGQGQIRRFIDRIPGERVYHVFLYGPSSLALGLGAVFGSKNRLIVYQYTDGDYQPVLDLSRDIRRIKEAKQTGQKYIEVKYPAEFTGDTAVIFDMVSHPAAGDAAFYVESTDLSPAGERERVVKGNGDVASYLKSAVKPMSIVEVKNTYGGHLAKPDWTGVVRELYGVLTRLEAEPDVRRIHLFHGMPVALAFGVGIVLGTHAPVTVYNWEAPQGTYCPVLKLNELEHII